jgi:hypothetical protein
MPSNVTGSRFHAPFIPTFPSPLMHGVPTPFGQQHPMLIYIAKEPPKLKLLDDWNGTKETWPLFKMKVEMACQKVNMTFLTLDTETTVLTANASKQFAEALHKKAPHIAMADFLGSARDFYCTRGIEMFQRLHHINKPTHPNAVSSIIEQLSSICMLPSETLSAFKLCIELLNERLPVEVAYTPALLAWINMTVLVCA